MRRQEIALNRHVCGLLLSIVVVLPAAANAQDTAAETAIRAIVAEQAVAWNAGDGSKYASRLAPAFAKRHQEILSTFYKGTTKQHVVRRIRFVTPDVAIVDIDNEVHGVKTMPPGIAVPPDGIIKTQLMEVFVRRNGQWWVEAYHNVDTKPAATP